MLLLKAVETNRGIIGPGEWERRSWKIQTDGTYRLKTTYRPVDPADPTPPQQRAHGESPSVLHGSTCLFAIAGHP